MKWARRPQKCLVGKIVKILVTREVFSDEKFWFYQTVAGYNQSRGGRGYNNQSQGGREYNNQSQGGRGYNNQSQGGRGYNNQSQGGRGYSNQSQGRGIFKLKYF